MLETEPCVGPIQRVSSYSCRICETSKGTGLNEAVHCCAALAESASREADVIPFSDSLTAKPASVAVDLKKSASSSGPSPGPGVP